MDPQARPLLVTAGLLILIKKLYQVVAEPLAIQAVDSLTSTIIPKPTETEYNDYAYYVCYSWFILLVAAYAFWGINCLYRWLIMLRHPV
ncbi:Hypothetical protein MVR_LOCUS302 [uncultured virus]|nr:Hypothetical protein MVR_LOCUS302 [uncultured virus]